MKNIEVLKKMIKEMLRQAKEESYSMEYGEGYKRGKIEAIENILKLLP